MAKKNAVNNRPTNQQPVKTVANATSHEIDHDVDVDDVQEPQSVVQSFKRNLTGMKEVFTDLFKLMTATVIKYEGWDISKEHPESHPAKFSHWEHTHPFRTYDRKGQKQTTCTPIGGHFHMVEWEEGKADETPKIRSVSGPMVMERRIVRGRPTMVPVPANDYDFHTHDVEYIRSSKVEFSTTNVEAAKVIAYEAQKTAPIPGVTVR